MPQGFFTLNSRVLFFVALSLNLLPHLASAGEVLRLNSGVVRTQDYVTQFTTAEDNAEFDLILQFKNKIQSQDHQWLSRQGIQVLGYLPEDALVVRANVLQRQKIQQLSQLNAVIPYHSSFKISPDLDSWSVFNREDTQVVMIKLFTEKDLGPLLQKIETKFPLVEVLSAGGQSLTVAASSQDLFQLSSLTGVEHIQPETTFSLMMFDPGLEDLKEETPAQPGNGTYEDLSGYETGTKLMNIPEAWALGFTGKNQVTAYADTGLDVGRTQDLHVDFQTARVQGQIFGLFSKSWADPQGHGTHVAGSILGRGSSSRSTLRGGAFDAQLVAQGMWTPLLRNISLPPRVGELFAKAYNQGARVHSNSWGAAVNLGAYDQFAQMVDEYMFRSPEMLVVFAAGNSGVDKDKDGRIDPGSVSTPGTAKNVLTVGASENLVSNGGIQKPISELKPAPENWPVEPINSSKISDNPNGIAMFSSRGPTRDGRIKPDIVAPGTNILSTRSHDPKASTLWGAYNQDYVWAGGTSMATPLTAGAATVTRQWIQETHKIEKPTAALVKSVLIHSAIDLYPGQYGTGEFQEMKTHRPNGDEGYGRVNLTGVLQMSAPQTKLVDDREGVGPGEQKVYEITLTKPGKILAHLVYTDAPGSPNARTALVNDLDLILVLPNRSELAPHDRVNNVEMIETEELPAGTYKLIVRGEKVPFTLTGKQAFALIYSLK